MGGTIKVLRTVPQECYSGTRRVILSAKDIGLSKDIIVDSAETYKYFHHPLCIYVVDDDNVYPIVVSQTPDTPHGQKASPDIIMFVQHFANALKELADMNIDGGDFFCMIDQYKNNFLAF